VPLLLFGSALARKPFVPVSYRLTADQLRAVLARLGPGILVAAPDAALPVPLPDGLVVRTREQFLATVRDGAADLSTPSPAPEDIAALLFASGTTGAPKAAVLRQRQLAAYIINTVEFLGAEPEEAALISVPPYHIAGISAILSSVYAGRRIVQLEAFEPRAWVRLVNDEHVTHAMVVPTMLTRIVDVLLADRESVPSLRHLSYGGGRMPAKTIETALRLLPHIDFVNAYGLTETSSTIAVLGPGDHRASRPAATRAAAG
jgi:acyl-CoA synthetase (AMP-forming)/AMP-acid ligase II